MSFNSKEGEIEKKYDIKSRGGWFTPQEGESKIRFISDDVDFGEHNDSELKRGMICTGKETCKYCQRGDKANVKFLAWIIDREDGKVKLGKFAYTVHKKMEKLAKSDDYKFDGVPPYDVTITRSGKGLKTEYDVFAARNDSPLAVIGKDDTEKVIKEKTDAMNELIEKTIKPIEVIIQGMKDKLLKETSTEIDVEEVLQEKPVKEVDEKIVLSENK